MAKYYTNISAGDTLTSIQANGSTYNVSVSQDLDCQDIDCRKVTATGALEATTGTFSGAVSGTTGTFTGQITAASASAQVKSFNIPHPSPGKEGKRLWHGSLEGPEHGVYVRGRLQDEKVIKLPDYWPDLVDMNSITVQLTQIGYSQDLMVETIEGTNISIKSGTSHNINCYYTVNATRKDVPPLEIEQDS